jgi:hypothetical protein
MLIQWLKEGGNVGIHGAFRLFYIFFFYEWLRGVIDATNSSLARRCVEHIAPPNKHLTIRSQGKH